MAGGGGAPQQGGADNSMSMIWSIAAVLVILFAIWYAYSKQLKTFFIKVKFYELMIINAVMRILPLELFNLGDVKKNVASALNMASIANYENLTKDMAQYLSLTSGKFLNYPITICLLIFLYYNFFKDVSFVYKKKYNMFSLSNQESKVWPQIKPVIGLDLVSQPINSGPWAMAKSPLDFCKENKLIEVTVEQSKEFKPGSPPNFKMTLDYSKAEALFIKQLGNIWRSPEQLPIHRRALFSIFLARACRDTKVAQELLKQINESADSSNPKKLNFDGIDLIWRKYYGKQIIQEIIHMHAYEFTIFIDLLLLARQDGVLATADFLWLKPIDRLFWYVLNSVGRQTYFVEAAGSHAHFLVEKALRRGLSVPYVQEAVKALDLALQEIIYVPDDNEKQELLEKAK